MAASVVSGQNLGAGAPDRAESMCWKIAAVGMGITSAMALVIFIWAERIAGMLTGEPSVIAETARYLGFNMLSEPFMALSSVWGGSLQGAGDTKGAMWVIIISMWMIRLPLSSLLSLVLEFGATGVWAAMVCWDSDIGTGWPAWNIQDPSMVSRYFDESLSIYCGGIDNLIRHHDYSAAILESIRPYPMSRFWLHCRHLLVNGEKMSKSTGNII